MRLRADSKIAHLKKVPLFARCSERELSRIASLADEIDLPEGKELTREGERGREFFVLLDGAADVRRKGRKLNTLGPGDFLGEIALLTGTPRSATVTATTPVSTLVITGREFRSLLRDSPEIQRKVLVALADRLDSQTV